MTTFIVVWRFLGPAGMNVTDVNRELKYGYICSLSINKNVLISFPLPPFPLSFRWTRGQVSERWHVCPKYPSTNGGLGHPPPVSGRNVISNWWGNTSFLEFQFLRGLGGSQGQKQKFSHFVIYICCSPTHGLSKMGSLSSQLPTVAEIWVAEDTLFSRIFDVFFGKIGRNRTSI